MDIFRGLGCLVLALAVSASAAPRPAPAKVEQWGLYEIALSGPIDGNPFADVTLTAKFTSNGKTVLAQGFYDGDSTYRIRFMPETQGEWRYETQSNRAELNNKSGQFTCVAPSVNNHGPVRTRNTFHFAHADG